MAKTLKRLGQVIKDMALERWLQEKGQRLFSCRVNRHRFVKKARKLRLLW